MTARVAGWDEGQVVLRIGARYIGQNPCLRAGVGGQGGGYEDFRRALRWMSCSPRCWARASSDVMLSVGRAPETNRLNEAWLTPVSFAIWYRVWPLFSM